MNSPPAESPDSVQSLATLRRIVAVCEQYEQTWRTPQQQSIETLLNDFTQPARDDLLRRLVELDLELRWRTGETPSPAEYRTRFPDNIALIDSAYAQVTGLALRPRPAVRLSGYDLYERLGHGGMGVVYRARQHGTQRLVALKCIRPELLESLPLDQRQQLIDRFYSEARLSATLTHPNIVTVYDVGQRDGLYFMAMEYVAGSTLAQQRGTLAASAVAQILQAVARAVQYAHEHGIVHRDLKPSNIIVAHDGTPKVTDFGLARGLAETPITPAGALLGTPAYLAPEIISGTDHTRYSVQSDVYSLGVTLYELLTGRVPFTATEPLALLQQIVETNPAPLVTANNAIPNALATICGQCLRKEPTQRYASAGALADDLQRFLTNQAIHARPLGWGARGRRWLRSPVRRLLVAGGVVFVGSVVLAIALGVRPAGWDDWRYHRHTAALTQHLRDHGVVELVEQAPAYRWRFGSGETTWADGAWSISSQEPTLLEVLPDPGHDAYDVHLQARQEECYNAFGAVALYVGHQAQTTNIGVQHRLVRIAFADLGPPASFGRLDDGTPCARLELGWMVGERTPTNPSRVLNTSDPDRQIRYRAPAPFQSPGPWRKLTVQVRPQSVRVICHWQEDAKIELVPQTRWEKFLTPTVVERSPELLELTGPWNPRGALGLYVYGSKFTVASLTLRVPTNLDESN